MSEEVHGRSRAGRGNSEVETGRWEEGMVWVSICLQLGRGGEDLEWGMIPLCRDAESGPAGLCQSPR